MWRIMDLQDRPDHAATKERLVTHRIEGIISNTANLRKRSHRSKDTRRRDTSTQLLSTRILIRRRRRSCSSRVSTTCLTNNDDGCAGSAIRSYGGGDGGW